MHAPTSYMDQQIVSPWWKQLCGWLWKISVSIAGILLSLGGNIFSTWFTNSKGIIPPDSPYGWAVTHQSLLVILGLCSLFFAVLIYLLSHWPTSPSLTTSLAQQNRERMLRRLRRIYQELRNQSLQEIPWLDIKLADKPNAVQNTTNLLLPFSKQAKQTLPISTSIEQIYEEAAHELLILGEPGAGKSMLLYQLAHILVERAEKDVTLALPVILPLSSWAARRPDLEMWIAEQLSSPLYDVPHQVSREWIRNEQILPLLDGLDEMETSARLVCIRAINTYHRHHQHPLVVCCQSTKYFDVANQDRLSLQRAIVVEPLSDQQVNEVLIQADKPLDILRLELRKNAELSDLAKSPLWLNILLLTYQGVSVRTLPKRRKALQQQIFTTYVAHAVERKGNFKSYSFHQTIAGLSWLAKGMRAHNQSTFYLEELQSDWLTQRFQHSYQWSVRLINALIGLLIGSLSNLVVGGPLNGLIGGFIWMLLFLLLFGRDMRIKPMETFSWSQKGAQLGYICGLISGLIMKLILGFVLHAVSFTIFLLITPAFMLAGMLSLGLRGKQLPKRDQLTPNEGIRRSAKVGLLSALPVALIFGLLSGLIIGVVNGLVLGLFSIIFIGIHRGFQATMRHFILRFWLWHTHVFPWKAVSFLEVATSCILLRRVGGGYSFTHRLLLDYFADLDVSTLQEPIIKQTPYVSENEQ